MIKFKWMIVLLFVLLGTSSIASACSCEPQGSFLTVAPKTNLVALVKITKYLSFKPIYDQQIPMNMEAEVILVYKGVETRKKITIWGDNGVLCRPYLSSFKLNDYYVIAFFGSSNWNSEEHKEKSGDYFISICGTYWLPVDYKKRIAFGDVGKQMNKIDLKDIKSKV